MATANFWPGIDPYVAAARTPLGVLALAGLAAVLCGWFVAPQGFIAFAAIATVATIGLTWPAVGIYGLSVQMQFGARRGKEGQATPVRFSIRNRWPWPVWGLTIEEGFSDLHVDDESTSVALARVGGWSRCDFEWDYIPPSRGLFPKTPPQLATAFPFGLWKAKRPIAVQEQLVVWPATFALPALDLSLGQQSWRGNPGDSHPGDDGECIGARPYQRGDSIRSIHWALTARHDRLIVREKQRAARTIVLVDVDVAPASHVGAGRQSTRERSLRIAASVCQSLLAQESPVCCRLGGAERTFVPSERVRTQLMDWLATFDAVTTDRSSTNRRDQYVGRASTADYQIVIATDRSSLNRGVLGSKMTLPFILSTHWSGSSDQRQTPVEPAPLETKERRSDAAAPTPVIDQIRRGWRRGYQEISHGS
ncbi:MAG: DUF58 domain-containing protein [Planctomycetaceae bacterium]|nr:DUF58 domain-containing protein [Planctomycetaceae bacterium]